MILSSEYFLRTLHTCRFRPFVDIFAVRDLFDLFADALRLRFQIVYDRLLIRNVRIERIDDRRVDADERNDEYDCRGDRRKNPCCASVRVLSDAIVLGVGRASASSDSGRITGTGAATVCAADAAGATASGAATTLTNSPFLIAMSSNRLWRLAGAGCA